MSGVTVATMIRSIDAAATPASARAAIGRRLRDVGQRLLLGREPPLADPGALDDPLVRRVDVLLEVLVREDAVRDVARRGP